MDRVIYLPNKIFGYLDKRTASIESRIDKQTDKYLLKLLKQENKLRRKLNRQDSTLAKQLFNGVDERYSNLKNSTSNLNTSVYSGHLDSLSTSINFLQSRKISQGISNSELQKTLDQYKSLQLKINSTEQVRIFLKQRGQLLKDQFEKLGLVKELKKFRAEVYYYQAQMQEYRQELEDPTKIEQRLLSLVQGIPQFRDFFARNSILGSMFALPGNNGSVPTASLQGLQTRAMLNQSIVSRFGNSANASQLIQQNIQSAQGQLSQLRNAANNLSSGNYGNSSGDLSIPGFKPSNQKTRSFIKRLEMGTNIQSQKARYLFPVTTDIGLSLGYKINDNGTIGIGASYKLGWGKGWNLIRMTQEGASLRSFLDWKIKGSFYVSGGYEQNYRNEFISMAQLKNYTAWQKSGLIGLIKKYQVSRKVNGNIQLLWDFLSYQQLPRTQPILFRIGYSLK